MPEFSFQELQLENFKTYKNHIRFVWSEKITAVIGLNGTGKSSIVDAIQFVCYFPPYDRGSNAANLKKSICNLELQELDDPSDTWVEMSVYVKNTDTQTRFRRIIDYQNLTQRYCINEEEVSLKVYKKSLLQCNINPRAVALLVQQSSIENFATQSPTELCAFFERLSGSDAYKAEYTRLSKELQCLTAEVSKLKKKRNESNQHLKNIEMMKVEMDKIIHLENEYKNCEYEYYLAKFYQIDQSINDLTNNNSVLCKQISAAEKIKTSTEKDIELHKSMLTEQIQSMELLETQVEEAKQSMLDYSTKETELKDNLALTENKIKKIKDNLQKAEIKVKSHENILKDLNQQKMEVEKEREAFLSQSQKSPLSLTDEQNELYLQLKSKALKKCYHEINMISAISREQSAIKDKIDEYKANKNLLSQKIMKEKSFIEEINLKMSNIVKKINETEQKKNSIETNINNLMAEIVSLENKQKPLLADIRKLEEEINEQQDAMESSQNQKILKEKQKLLEELKAKYNGVHDRLINVCQVGGENIDCDELEIVITKILGKKIDNIIVDKSSDAVRCIKFIKERYKGSKYSVFETFLPLDNLKIKNFDKRILKGEENARLAIDVMSFSEEYRDVLTYALGNAVICDTDEAASDLSQRKHINCISYNGTFYKKDGIFSGGLYDLSKKSAKIWNEKKLQVLINEKANKLNLVRENVKCIESKNQQKCELENELESLVKRLAYLKSLLQDQQSEIKIKKEKLSDLEELLDKHKNSEVFEDLENAFEIKTNDLEKFEKKKKKIENGVFSEFCSTYHLENIQQYEMGDLKKHKERADRKKEFDDHLDKINNQIEFESKCCSESKTTVRKLRIDLQKTTEMYEKLQKKLAKLGNRHSKNKSFYCKDAELKQMRQKLDELKKRIKMKEAERKLVKDDLKAWTHNFLTDKKNIAILKSKRRMLLTECKIKNIDIPLINETMETVSIESKLSSETSDTISKHTSLSESVNIQEKNIQIDYSNHLQFLRKIEVDIDNAVESLKQKLISIRTEIDENVPNLTIDDKKMIEIKKKVDTLKENYSNKRKELQDKNENFNDVKNKRVSTFKKFFSFAEEKLEQYFKTLYQNSTATAHILMINQDEPYLDGIVFSCGIPNKKYTAMENLSGGEKTMCSIALLYAVNDIKQPPFYVFDEIDAALDNVNINKVINFFLKMKDSTQIIIISHHELMSACADSFISVNISPITNSTYAHHLDVSMYSKEYVQNLKDNAMERLADLRSKMQNK